MFDELKSSFNFIFGAALLFGGWGYLYYCLTGWRRLTTLYARRDSSLGISQGSFKWVWCSSRWTSLTVSLEIYPQGLWLKPGFPLNLFMPALLIPWDQLEVTEVRDSLLRPRAVFRMIGITWPFIVKGRAGVRVSEFLVALRKSEPY